MANKGASIALIGAGIGLAILTAALLLRQKAAPSQCTGAFLAGLNGAIGSIPGDTKWDPKYDLDKDGLISNNDAALFKTTCPNVCDLAKMQAAWGSVIGDPNYDPVYDFNQDGVIDISDASIRVLVCPY